MTSTGEGPDVMLRPVTTRAAELSGREESTATRQRPGGGGGGGGVGTSLSVALVPCGRELSGGRQGSRKQTALRQERSSGCTYGPRGPTCGFKKERLFHF